MPVVQGLPLVVDGILSGNVKMMGSLQPLLPVFDGKLGVGLHGAGQATDGKRSRHRGWNRFGRARANFGLLGMVRALTLGQAELQFSPSGSGTKITGRLFDSFDVDGVLSLLAGCRAVI